MARLWMGAAVLSALGIAACSSGSGSGMSSGGSSATGGSGASSGASGSGATAGSSGSGASGGSSGASGSGGAGGSGGGPPATWTVIENDSLYGTKAIAGHPSDPNGVAFLLERTPLQPGAPLTVSVALSTDGGQSFTFSHVMDIPDPAYIYANGFLYDPHDAQKLAGAINFPYGFEFQDLWRLLRSDDGGASFSATSMVQLELLKWVPGSPGALVARAQDGFSRSTDFGQSFVPLEPPGTCTAISDYTETPSARLYACGAQGIERCAGASCQLATLPSGAGSVFAIERIPGDASRVVALAGEITQEAQLLASSDGGQSFGLVQALPAGNWNLRVDPRPDGTTIVAHDLIQHGVWRSGDAGASFADVTPSATLPNPRGLSTYAYELGVTADGGIVAYTAAGVLRWSP